VGGSGLDIMRELHPSSPAGFFLALVHRRYQSFPDGFTHAWDRQKVKRLLDGVPIFFAKKYAIGARAGDEDRLVGGRRFIEQPVQLLAGLAGIDGDHIYKRALFRTFRQAFARDPNTQFFLFILLCGLLLPILADPGFPALAAAAMVMSQLLRGRAPDFDLEPFSPLRFR
jgi:hypothetical protein